jgi:hypothetical protein
MNNAHPIKDEVSAALAGSSIVSRSTPFAWPEPPTASQRRRRIFALTLLALMDFIEWQLLIGLILTSVLYLVGAKP